MYDFDGNIIFQYDNGNSNGIVEDNQEKIKIFLGENLKEQPEKEIVNGKEFDYNGRLLFEGEFSKKVKWKGKVKEYYKDELVFEGDYSFGKKWNGKGKKYNSKENLIFEGEYIDGIITGYVKNYGYDDKLEFEGNFIKPFSSSDKGSCI